ncbi:chloride channel protein [candidate division KSB1 bacterium]
MVTLLQKVWNQFKDAGSSSKLITLSVLVGLFAGAGSIVFHWLLNVSEYFFQDFLIGYRPYLPAGEHHLFQPSGTDFRPFMFFIIPALGGLLSGLLVFSLAPEAEGHGTDAAIETFHKKRGKIRARVPFIKIIASSLTLGSGGSAGAEGPIAQIGSGFGSLIGQWLKLSPHDRRILMVAGMGAGIGAIFRAPFAGALFASEVLYREAELEYEVIIPSTIASAVSYGVFAAKFGWTPLFETPGFVFSEPTQLIPYTALAIIIALSAKLFIRIFYYIRDLFEALPGPPHLKPMYGGFLVGCIGFFLPEAIGTGYGNIQQGINFPYSEITLQFLVILAIGKMFSTAFCAGSGGSGGIFGPSVVIGGTIGGAVGMLFILYVPHFNIEAGAFVIVGIAGFFSAAAKTPIAMIFMVSEITGDYHLIVPAMWVTVIAFFANRSSTLYEKQLYTRFDSPAHLGNFIEDILRQLQVRDALLRIDTKSFPIIQRNAPLPELIDHLAKSDYKCYPVIDEQNKLVGMVKANEVRLLYKEHQASTLVVAHDLIAPAVTVSPSDSLFTALRRAHEQNVRDLVVVDENDAAQVIGILSSNDIITAYDREIKRSMTDIRRDILSIR